MHKVREYGYEYILVGLGTVLSKRGFNNFEIQIGDKVRLIAYPIEVRNWREGLTVRAAGFEGTWGTVGKHYQVDYLYPYMIDQEENEHER